MNIPRPILAISALALAHLAPTSTAQFVEFDASPKSLRWAVPPTAAFNRTAMGDIDGDLLQDICFLDGNELRFVFGPALFGALMEPRPEAVDVDVWPGYVAGRDAAVTVSSKGARVHTWDPAMGLWTNDKISQHDDWNGATVVEVRVPPAGPPEVFGAVRNGMLLRVLRNGDDDVLTPADRPILDLELADLDGDGVRELACVADDRMHILEITGVDAQGKDVWTYKETHFAFNFLSVGAVRGRQATETREWLSWLGTWPYTTPPEQWLTLVQEPAVSAPLLIANDPDVVGFAVGDWAGDASLDLVQSWTKTKKLGVLVNQTTGDPPFGYGPTSSFELDYGAPSPENPAPNNRCWPALADGDGDGDDDLFFLVQSTGKLHVGFNDKVDENGYQPDIDGGEQVAEDSTPPSMIKITNHGGVERFEFDVVHAPHIPSDVNALEIILWQMPPGDDPTAFVPEGPTIPMAIDYACYDGLDPTAPPDIHYMYDLEETFQDHPQYGEYLASLYLWIMRYVRKEAGQVVKVYPAQAFGMQVKGDAADLGDADAQACDQFLEDHGGVDPFYPVVDGDTAGLPSAVLIFVGSIRAIPCVPAFPVGSPPGWQTN